MSTQRKEPFGRPTIYTQELADYICRLVATNTCGLTKLCETFDGMPDSTTINAWRFEKPDFSRQYAQAKMFQAELLAENVIELSAQKAYYIDAQGNERVDTGFIQSQALQVNTVKWHASKLAPKIYGDKSVVEHKNEESAIDVTGRVAKIKKDEKEY